MQAAQRRVLPTWEEVKDDPPQGRAILTEFPPPEMALLHAIVDHDAWAFARKFLKTEGIHFRAGCMIARYPGFKGPGWSVAIQATCILTTATTRCCHSPRDAREFGQIGFWVHLEDVDEDQAPLETTCKGVWTGYR